MDLGSVIAGLICLAIFIIPVVLIQGNQKRQKKKLLDQFLELARQQEMEITRHDLWNQRYAIGFDVSQHILFYSKTDGEKVRMYQVSLPDVAACQVVNQNRDTSGSKVIDLIGLRLTFRDKRQPEQHLEFYNREETMTLNQELMLAQKWNTLVNTHLRAPLPQQSPTAGGGSPQL